MKLRRPKRSEAAHPRLAALRPPIEQEEKERSEEIHIVSSVLCSLRFLLFNFRRDVMSQSEPLIRNISDTARWAAVYRAREAERPDALFRDTLARRLAGDRGEQIAKAMPFTDKHTWSWIT